MKFGDYTLTAWRFLAWIWVLPVVMMGPVHAWQTGALVFNAGMGWMVVTWFVLSLIHGLIFVQVADAFAAHTLPRLLAFGAVSAIVLWTALFVFGAAFGQVQGNVMGFVLAPLVIGIGGALHAAAFFFIVLFRGFSGAKA